MNKDQQELPSPAEGIPESIATKAETIAKLLPNLTSLGVVSEFLKSKQLHHSAGSWEEMYTKRILPALRQNKLSIKDLIRLLGDAEEFGRAHVFLYRAKKEDIANSVRPDRIKSVCQKLGQSDVLKTPLVVELPEKPTLAEIRAEDSLGHQCWVFKIVETRREKKYLGETIQGNVLRKEWEFHDYRAVNVARLHASGFLEVRIQSHANNSTQYSGDVSAIWKALKEFLPHSAFATFPLAKAKKRLWDNRKGLKDRIRFSDSVLRNGLGNTLIASTGAEQGDLFSDSGAAGSIDHFLKHGAHCDSTNVWWRRREDVTGREIHMLLSGLENEFAVTAYCTRTEYEYVLNELRINNR
jgi:hypothetical protein